MARCPAHGDRNPSLHITLAKDRWLLKCQAGCPTEEVVDAAGLSWGDLFSDENRNGNGRREIVATYPYTDARGKLLFEVVRFQPKGFAQRQPVATGWSWKVKGVRRVLYRLPDVRKAVRAGKPVWVVEGEKDVHALELRGVVATCSPGGAGKWREDYSKSLAGATVALIVDKDREGREHARLVKTSLERKGCTVKPAEAYSGKDAYDHLAAGCGLDGFVPIKLDIRVASPPRELFDLAREQFGTFDQFRDWVHQELGQMAASDAQRRQARLV